MVYDSVPMSLSNVVRVDSESTPKKKKNRPRKKLEINNEKRTYFPETWLWKITLIKLVF